MKTILKYTTSLFMILILLVSTLQFSVYKMECLITGNTLVSFSEIEDCTPPKKDNSVNQRCCDFNNITLDFDYETNTNVKTFNVFNPPIAINPISTILFGETFKTNLSFCYTNLPPPSGSELLKLVQVFRI